MSISYDPKKIKNVAIFTLILVLVLFLAYAIATLTVGKSHKSRVTVVYQEKQESGFQIEKLNAAAIQSVTTVTKDEPVVASKKGTKYHLPSCPGAKAIIAQNKITFPNQEAAKKAGYGPAKNCKGLNPTTK